MEAANLHIIQKSPIRQCPQQWWM